MDNKQTVQKMKERLHWYIHKASYSEYNDQEVNYILTFLHEHDSEHEEKIEKAAITYCTRNVVNKNKQRNMSSKTQFVKTVSALIVAATLFFSIISYGSSIAGRKAGIFNFIEKDESGSIIVISPEHNQEVSTSDSLDEVSTEYHDGEIYMSDLMKHNKRKILESENKATYNYSDSDVILTKGELHEILGEAQRQKETMEREQGFFFSDERKRAMFE